MSNDEIERERLMRGLDRRTSQEQDGFFCSYWIARYAQQHQMSRDGLATWREVAEPTLDRIGVCRTPTTGEKIGQLADHFSIDRPKLTDLLAVK